MNPDASRQGASDRVRAWASRPRHPALLLTIAISLFLAAPGGTGNPPAPATKSSAGYRVAPDGGTAFKENAGGTDAARPRTASPQGNKRKDGPGGLKEPGGTDAAPGGGGSASPEATDLQDKDVLLPAIDIAFDPLEGELPRKDEGAQGEGASAGTDADGTDAVPPGGGLIHPDPGHGKSRAPQIGVAAPAFLTISFYLIVLLLLGALLIYLLRSGWGGLGFRNRAGRKLLVAEIRPLGNRQFLAVAEYESTKILIGISPGRIDFLCNLPAPAEGGFEKIAAGAGLGER